jgi:hypothetical protein
MIKTVSLVLIIQSRIAQEFQVENKTERKLKTNNKRFTIIRSVKGIMYKFD